MTETVTDSKNNTDFMFESFMILMFYFYLHCLFSTLNVMLMNFVEDPPASLCPCNAPQAGQGCIRTYNNRAECKHAGSLQRHVRQGSGESICRPIQTSCKERQRNIVFSHRYGPGAFLRASLDKRNSPASQPERFISLRQGLFVFFLLDDVIKLIHKIKLYVESTGKTHIFWNQT